MIQCGRKIVRNYYYIMLIIFHNKVSVLQTPTAKQCQTHMHMFQSYPCRTAKPDVTAPSDVTKIRYFISRVF